MMLFMMLYLTFSLTSARFFAFFSCDAIYDAICHAICSASVNGILQCGLGGQKLYKGEKRDLSSKMRPKCGPILELLRTEESLFSSKYQKIFKKLILRKKCECLFFMVGLSYNPISQKMQAPTLVLNLISTSYSLLHSFTATFLSKWENETF